MAKEKLKAEQFKQLQGLNLTQKLNLLLEWSEKGEITLNQCCYFSNLWLARDTMKKIAAVENPFQRTKRQRKKHCPETEMIVFRDKLQALLNEHIANREKIYHLSSYILEQIKKMIYTSPHYRDTIDQLLVTGLKFPDKELNQICFEYIQKFRMSWYYMSPPFWTLLWSDNFVPLDAIRLMLTSDDTLKFEINPAFEQNLIRTLLPMMVIQRDKEIIWLQWTQAAFQGQSRRRDEEVAWRTRRLNAFNMLIDAAEQYV